MVDEAMFIVSTAFLVQSKDGRVVILAYRGTEPINFINWLTDADLSPTAVQLQKGNLLARADGAPLLVHGGFYRNVRATRYKVMQTLARATKGIAVTAPADEDTPTVQPMEALYITGHSLGAAMAAIATMLLKNTPEHDQMFGAHLKATYTFAQPMVGNEALAEACNGDAFLGQHLFRFVYEKDPVPHLPSRDLNTYRNTYRNFGVEYGYGGTTWARRAVKDEADQMYLIINTLGAGIFSVARYLPVLRVIPVPYLLDDHRPNHYIEALTEPGELTEFGDNVYA
jgi:Lipase (class 3)